MTQHTRNLTWLAFVEVGWGLGFGVISAPILMPVFLRELGAGNYAIALVPVILALGHTAPQLWTPYFTSHLSSKKKTTIIWHLVPAALWLFAPLYFFLWRGTPPFHGADVAVFLSIFAVASGLVGYAIPLWLDYVSRITEPSRWGHVTGVLFSVQTLSAAGGAWIASFIVGRLFSFPKDYAFCYFASALLWAVGTLAFFGTREPKKDPPPHLRKPFPEYVRGFFDLLWREPRMRRYLASRACVQVYPALLSFYANHAVDLVHASGSDAAQMSAVFLFFQTLGSYSAGKLGERWGHMRVMAAGNSALFLAMGVVYFASSLWHFYLASALGGLFFSSFLVSHVNWLLRFGKIEEDKTLILSVPSVLLAPAMVAGPLLVGYLVEAFSYKAALLFAMSVTAVGVALAFDASRKE